MHGEDLDGHRAIEARIASAVDLTHAAGAEWRDDLVRPEPGTARESHGRTVGYRAAGAAASLLRTRAAFHLLGQQVEPVLNEQIYPNLFINHMGLTPAGAGTSDPVIVELSAVSNTTGAPAGTTLRLTINSGQTSIVSGALQALQIPAGSDDTILVYARVVSGNAAIHGIVSQIDNTTRDGSVFDMSRAD